MLNSKDIRQKFLDFFEKRGHKIVPSSSLVPEGDISVLFTTAGMQQFKPYYGAPENAIKDFGSKNVVTVQKCVRTGDIEEVGDDTHLSFFEMLGNFSFGGYGRKEAIEYAYEFMTKELGLQISYVTFYKGEGVVPKDEESKAIWESLGVADVREDGSDVFWGPTGLSGPCGPTTEIYCKNANGDDVEVWNIVFNEYFCDGTREQLDKGEAKLTKLDTLGIDTGMGFERLLATVQNVKSVYDTDLFENELKIIKDESKKYNEKSSRIIADHIRTASFIISDGITFSPNGKGYVLRKLVRRAYQEAIKIELPAIFFQEIIREFVLQYSKIYPDLFSKEEVILAMITDELSKFGIVLSKRKKFVNFLYKKGYSPITVRDTGSSIIDHPIVDGADVFLFEQEEGTPFDILRLWLEEESFWESNSFETQYSNYKKAQEKHQKLSQTASAGMFKGGLANHNEQTIKLHTAHHLLLAGLQAIVSPEIKQRGSNITEERLRIDFLCDHKLTDEEKKGVEDWVNDKIQKSLNVVRREMPLVEAEKLGAQMEFGAKYPEVVSVYFIGPSASTQDDAVSIEFCGGPHVENTKNLGVFKIQKEEAVSAGVRRIKAILT